MANPRLDQQLLFIAELDKLKTVLRQSPLLDKSRRENSAEHSWHLAMMALVLHEYAPAPGVDLAKVLKMLLVHDIVEIDAGDAFIYDSKAQAARPEKERNAAARIFGLLPTDLAEELMSLWQEFEAKQTPEAKFAGALDRFQPLLGNCLTEGETWKAHRVTAFKVWSKNREIGEGTPELWALAQDLIRESVARGWLRDPEAMMPTTAAPTRTSAVAANVMAATGMIAIPPPAAPTGAGSAPALPPSAP